jgi:hypothetical protein
MEQLLTNHDLTVKSWHVQHNSDDKKVEKQVRDHLVRMRQAFVQKSIIFCSKDHTQIILDQVGSHLQCKKLYYLVYYLNQINASELIEC